MLATRENFSGRRRRHAGPACRRRAGRSTSASTAAAGLPAIVQLIGAVDDALHHSANTVFDAGVQHDVR